LSTLIVMYLLIFSVKPKGEEPFRTATAVQYSVSYGSKHKQNESL